MKTQLEDKSEVEERLEEAMKGKEVFLELVKQNELRLKQ